MILRFIKSIVLLALLGSAGAVYFIKPRDVQIAPPGFTHVLYWEKWSGEEAAHMKSLVDEFNRTVGQDKRIFVDYVSMTAVDQKTLVATAAGVPPDISGLWDGQLAQFAAMDALTPLDEYAKDHGIDETIYKPVFWNACHYRDHLYALCSTPWPTVLMYDKQAFADRAPQLRAAGLDPDRPPRSIAELDEYAAALTTLDDRHRLKTCGFLPLEPGWYIATYPTRFGGDLFDPKTQMLRFDSEPVLKCFDWISGYSQRLGKEAVAEFRSGFGGFTTAQNPFLSGTLAMEEQGPWFQQYIANEAPSRMRWHVPAEKLAREKAFEQLRPGLYGEEISKLIGLPNRREGNRFFWDAGVHQIALDFGPDDRVWQAHQAPPDDECWPALPGGRPVPPDAFRLTRIELILSPAAERREYAQLGCAAFPTTDPAITDSGYCGSDCMAVPRGSKHAREAFEFIAFVNRQDIAEKLALMQCADTPLKKVSPDFFDKHPNPYIELFEQIANGPHGFAITPIPIYAQVKDEFSAAADRASLLVQSPDDAARTAGKRLEGAWNEFKRIQSMRDAQAGAQ